jgi:hypothetical protein
VAQSTHDHNANVIRIIGNDSTLSDNSTILMPVQRGRLGGDMRDGIWKGLALPREWRSVLRSCAREAERGDVAAGKLAHALAKALAGVSSSFIRRLQMRADEGPALPGMANADTLGGTTVLEGRIAARFVQLEAAGLSADAFVSQAIAEATHEWREACGRQIRQHCHREAGVEAGAVVSALAAAEAAVDVNRLAAARIAGEKVSRAAPRRPIDLDEDLTRSP